MASSLSNGKILSDGALAASIFPGHIDGYIDMIILVDIQKSLSQSEKSDDISLATWIKQNYLQEPLSEIGRPIRDAEGYANLDKAYRRVRQLTGKAKDEWPFFDRNWKKLSSTFVKNAILGDATVGTTQFNTSSQLRDAPMHNRLRGQHDKTLQLKEPQAPSSTIKRNSHLTQKQESLKPAVDTLSEATELEFQRKGPDLFPNSDIDSVPRSAAKNDDKGTPPYHSSATPSADILRDAGAGKVRGSHGRFVNNSKKSSPARDKVSKSKHVRNSRSKNTTGARIEEVGALSDEDVITPKVALKTSITSPESEEDAFQSDRDRPQEPQSMDNTTRDLQVSVSAILAAEAEAIPSSLDRLPPGFAHKKRKSETSIDRGGLKRARGSRGGVLGRPRKSETLAKGPQSVSEEHPTIEQSPTQPEMPVGTSLKVARRSSRKSAASALELSTPWDPTADVLINGSGQNLSSKYSADVASNGVNNIVNGDYLATEVSTSVTQNSIDNSKEIVDETLSSTPTRLPSLQSSMQSLRSQTACALSKEKKRVSFSSQAQASDVQFFARISTSSGIKDVPLLEEDLKAEVDLVKRYAAWQKAGNTNATFEVFKNIAHFTK